MKIPDSTRYAWVVLWLGLLVAPLSAMADETTPSVSQPRHAYPRQEAFRERNRMRAERLRAATPEEREARRERMLERLQGATPLERRRLLRRERRMMGALPDEVRRQIREENRSFRDKHGLPEPGAAHGLARELDLTPEERRVLRARVRELPRDERRDLWREIQRLRSLSPEEREALEGRLNEMKLLTHEEREALRQKARRWSEMSEEKRERLREQMRRLRELPPDERAALLERAFDAEKTGSP